MVTRRRPAPSPIPEVAKDWFGDDWSSTAPDPESVRRFIRSTRRRPQIRLHVLNDLRQHAHATHDTGFESLWIGVLAVYVAVPTITFGAWAGTPSPVLIILTAVLLVLVVVMAVGLVLSATYRLRGPRQHTLHARLWLDAIDDELHRRR
jgi:hypothetical protein